MGMFMFTIFAALVTNKLLEREKAEDPGARKLAMLFYLTALMLIIAFHHEQLMADINNLFS